MNNKLNLSEEEMKNWETAIYERAETSSTQAMQALLQLHKEGKAQQMTSQERLEFMKKFYLP